MSTRQNNGVTPPTPMGIDKVPGAQTALNVTAAATVKAAPGRLARINVIVAGSAAGAAYDTAAAANDAVGTEVFVIPNTVGTYEVDWPCQVGITVVPGTGQTIAVSFY
jgi:hypothetical protein